MGSKVESNVIMKSNQGCLKIAFFHPDLVCTSVIPHLADGLNGTLYVCMAMYSRVSLLWATAYISCHCWDLLNSILLHRSSAGRLLCGQQKPWSYGQIHAFLAFILHRIGMILLRLLRLCLVNAYVVEVRWVHRPCCGRIHVLLWAACPANTMALTSLTVFSPTW